MSRHTVVRLRLVAGRPLPYVGIAQSYIPRSSPCFRSLAQALKLDHSLVARALGGEVPGAQALVEHNRALESDLLLWPR